MKLVTDTFDDETLMKIIRKFIIHIYGKQLTMKENSSGYLRFYSVGPEPPYHRNLSGRLWIDDDRLYNIIKTWFSCDGAEALSLIAFYFSTYYNIKVTDARIQSHIFFDGGLDYSEFDDPNHNDEDNYNDDEEVITEEQSNFIKLTRRFHDVDRGVKNYLETLDRICNYPFDALVDSVKYNILEYMRYKYFQDMDEESEEWEHLSDRIFNYIEDKHKDHILEYYNKKCKK